MRDFLALLLVGALCALIWYVWKVYSAYVILAALCGAASLVVLVVWKLYRKFGRLIFGGVPYAMSGANIIEYANKYFGGDEYTALRRATALHFYEEDEAKRDKYFANMQEHLEKIRDALFNPANPAYAPVDLNALPESVRKALMPDFLGFYGKGWRYKCSLEHSGRESCRMDAEVWYYSAIGSAPKLDDWYRRRVDINGMMSGKMRVDLPPNGTGVFCFESGLSWNSPFDDDYEAEDYPFHDWQAWPNIEASADKARELFEAPPEPEFIAPAETLPFVGKHSSDGGHLHEGYIFLGTNIRDGKPYWKAIETFQHHLIVGMSGYGKSVFLNQLLQGVRHNIASYEAVYLVDLKGGVELIEYADYGEKFHVRYRYEDLHELVQSLCTMMDERLTEMREKRVKKWSGKRILFVVDEYAQIALQMPDTKEDKAAHNKLLANLNRLSMLGRAVGVLLWIQLQKSTTDVIDSSFRNNLQAQVCFRVQSRLNAAGLFGEAKDLEIDPVRLRRGQCIYYDDATGETVYLQAHMRTETKEAA